MSTSFRIGKNESIPLTLNQYEIVLITPIITYQFYHYMN